MTFDELIKGIHNVDPLYTKKCTDYWNSLAKPLGSLGVLENSVTKIAALKKGDRVSLDNAALLVFCADNGVVAQGVSQSSAAVTTAVAKALGEGKSTVNYMADEAHCQVVPVNVGMKEDVKLPGVLNRCIKNGTGDITIGPAMSRQECEKAILTGAELVEDEKRRGTDIILLGEMGIGNTTTSAAVACYLLDRNPEEMTGRGAGLSDEGLIRKKDAIRKALEVNCPDRSDPVDILSNLGGFDIAALCGVCLGCAYYRIPVLLDGVITCTAALLAMRMCPACTDAVLASHVSREPAAKQILKELKLNAPICADLHLGEGSGAVLCLSLLRQVLAVYNSGHTFEHLGIDAYTQQ